MLVYKLLHQHLGGGNLYGGGSFNLHELDCDGGCGVLQGATEGAGYVGAGGSKFCMDCCSICCGV